MIAAANKLGLVPRKPVFGVSDQVILKPSCSATEKRWNIEFLLVASLDRILSNKRITNALIRLIRTTAVLTYKALNNLAPAYISGLLKQVSETHTHSLRSSENGLLSVPRSRTALYDRSFSYSVSKLWNALPQSIRTKPSLKSFKTSLKAKFQT